MDPTPESAELYDLLSVGAAPAPSSVPVTLGSPAVPAVSPGSVPAAASAATASASTSAAGDPPGSKKRPLGQEDKKARERKRVLRNRELARVSNERRKGRIKAMENELNETRQTVSTLEESIRCLEAENKELKNLLQGKNAPAPGPEQQTQAQQTQPQ